MAIKAVLFDLDGTLLPMDLDQFTSGYFRFLIKKLSPLGYEPKKLVNSIWAGTAAMIRNDGTQSNEEAFWKDFVHSFGEKALEDRPLFEEFYAKDFEQARGFCGYTPKATGVVKLLREKGRRLLRSLSRRLRLESAMQVCYDASRRTQYDRMNKGG